ncbi:MAG: membrane protein insertase YidC [Planctomycetes bacterium]|nr:membrane protein insertase YidC [Planctomycetota bacterium]
MEKRVALLVVLCVVVFVGWNFVYQWMFPPPPRPPAAPERPAPAEPEPERAPKPQEDAPAEPAEEPAVQPEERERTSTVSNEHVVFVLTNRGAGIEEATVLLNGHQRVALLRPFDEDIPHLALQAEGSDDDLIRTPWTVAEESPQGVTYTFKMRNGLVIEKRFRLDPGVHSLRLLLGIRNVGGKDAPPVRVRFRWHVFTGLTHDGHYQYERFGAGCVGLKTGGAHSLKTISLDEPRKEGAPIKVSVPEDEADRSPDWFGLRNRYFAALFNPEDGPESFWFKVFEFRATSQIPAGGEPMKALAVDALSKELEIGASPFSGRFQVFLGPLREKELREVRGAERFLDAGCTGGLLKPIEALILWIVNAFHGLVGNYGFAIILTTLAVRLALFPLSKKSQVSMARMTELQPKLTALRERYGDNPQKMNQEQMKLFKEHGVNPLSGCLPILLQFPIWIALFTVFDTTFDFRQSPFIFWIRDLSQPDRLFTFDRPIPLVLFNLREVNLLPLIMTGTWFLQAYLAPRSQDPKVAAQQKMMMFMPVVFGMLCYSYASGVSLYFFVNSLLGIAEQKIIRKFFLPAKSKAPASV